MFGAFVNVILNALLIPFIGVNGAALASLITQFLTNIVTGYIFSPIRGVNFFILQGFNPKQFINVIYTIFLQIKKNKI